MPETTSGEYANVICLKCGVSKPLVSTEVMPREDCVTMIGTPIPLHAYTISLYPGNTKVSFALFQGFRTLCGGARVTRCLTCSLV